MVTVTTTKPIRVLKANPDRINAIISNLTASADVLISTQYYPDTEFDDYARVKLIGIDREELRGYKGEVWVMSASASADVRVMEY